MPAQETGSELQSGSEKGVYSHQPRIMCEALNDNGGSVRIGRRLITNFRFRDDIVVNAEENEEADVLVDRLDTTITSIRNSSANPVIRPL